MRKKEKRKKEWGLESRRIVLLSSSVHSFFLSWYIFPPLLHSIKPRHPNVMQTFETLQKIKCKSAVFSQAGLKVESLLIQKIHIHKPGAHSWHIYAFSVFDLFTSVWSWFEVSLSGEPLKDCKGIKQDAFSHYLSFHVCI